MNLCDLRDCIFDVNTRLLRFRFLDENVVKVRNCHVIEKYSPNNSKICEKRNFLILDYHDVEINCCTSQIQTKGSCKGINLRD